MKRALLAAALAASPITPEAPPMPAHPFVHARPESALTAYLEGRDQRDLPRLRSAFHPAVPIQWVDEKGEPRSMTQIEWWPRVASSHGPNPAVRDSVLDREGGLALAEASSTWPSHAFGDLLLLVDGPAGWRIVGKVFARRGPAERPSPERPGDRDSILAVLNEKIEAHAAWDPALLLASHLPGCLYFERWTPARDFGYGCLSEGGASYAEHRDRGEVDRETEWRIAAVIQRGDIAAAKLEAQYLGTRYVDYLLLLRTANGWRIAAAVWGDPSRS